MEPFFKTNRWRATYRVTWPAVLGAAVITLATPAAAQPRTAAAKITINEDLVTVIDGRKVFPIGFTLPPAPDAKAPNGRTALEEFRDAGALFIRTGPMREVLTVWDETWIAREKEYHVAAAKAGMFCLPFLKEYSVVNIGDTAQEQKLRSIIRLFKDSPGMGIWKGEDEPQWGEMNSTGKKSPPPLINAYRIIHDEDPNHPVWIVQAPRGTIAQLKEYNPTYDIGGVDIYPIGYPAGSHVIADANKTISMVGDYTRKMVQVVEGRKPIWLTLQIAWSGVVKPGKTLRFPTFHEERFMTYQAIINGARGLIFFGGNLSETLSAADRPYGWNWTFWRRVLRPVIEEVGDHGPLAAALVAPDSKLPIKVRGGDGIEWCARQVGGELYILACCRDPQKTALIEFTGLPATAGDGEVVYESPRKVAALNGAFKDWFAPYEVHVYKFRL